jgi:glycine/D-amino acid oxidase-like deaminating enzyme/nitrite reductase/ring-hydroxylating ferredoxin subunit
VTTPLNVSYWIASTPASNFPALDRDIEVDVAVVGGGIVGVTAALLLARRDRHVALIEMDRVARGTSGYTTAKLTAGHNAIYQTLERDHGLDRSKLYAEANQEGLALIARWVEEEDIECDFERKANYVYVESESEAGLMKNEDEACQRAGLQSDFVTEVSLPYPIAGAVRLRDQAQFHPRKYLLGLVDRLVDEGGVVFENTRAISLDEGSPCSVTTSGGVVSARQVVVATHYPFVDRALLFPRVHPKRSYAIAGPVDGSLLPEGMFISADQPTRSLRTIVDGGRTLLLVGGEGHGVGQSSDSKVCYRKLEEWAGEHFGMDEVEYRWSAQDGASVDRLPYIGTYMSTDDVFIATGFGKWGLTNGTIGAQLIADQITGVPNRFTALFDPNRIPLKASAQRLIIENAKVARHFLGDRIRHPQRRFLEDLAPGQAGVEDRSIKPVAAYRDEAGILHRMSAVCTHLGCVVTWNTAERSWDCPCHGSRYDIDGRVIQGPAVRDLERLDPRGGGMEDAT